LATCIRLVVIRPRVYGTDCTVILSGTSTPRVNAFLIDGIGLYVLDTILVPLFGVQNSSVLSQSPNI